MKKVNLFVRALALLLTIALVVGAVWLVANRDRVTLDALSRWYRYLTLSRSDDGMADSFSYEGQVSDLFADLDGRLLVAASSGIRLYSTGGTEYYDLAVTMNAPALSVGAKHAVVYDVGGSALTVVDVRGEVDSLPLESGCYLAATLNSKDYLTTVSRQEGYKAVVKVYDNNYQPIYTLRITSRFVLDAVVAPDGQSVAVLTIGLSENHTFETSFALYSLGSSEPYATCSLGNDVVLSLYEANGIYRVLGEQGLYFLSDEGTLLASYPFQGQYLKAASLTGKDFAAVLLGKYSSGTTATLVVLGVDGTILGSETVNDQVSTLACRGPYVALLTATQLALRTSSLAPYYTLSDTGGARNLTLREDGSCILISNQGANLYIPE